MQGHDRPTVGGPGVGGPGVGMGGGGGGGPPRAANTSNLKCVFGTCLSLITFQIYNHQLT